MDITEEARKIPHWTQMPVGTPDAVSDEVVRRCVMTSIAAESGGHIGTIVDRVLEAYLFAISPQETAFVCLPDEHEDRRMMLDSAVVSDHPDVETAVAALWTTMRQYRGAQIEREAKAIIETWLQEED